MLCPASPSRETWLCSTPDTDASVLRQELAFSEKSLCHPQGSTPSPQARYAVSQHHSGLSLSRPSVLASHWGWWRLAVRGVMQSLGLGPVALCGAAGIYWAPCPAVLLGLMDLSPAGCGWGWGEPETHLVVPAPSADPQPQQIRL